jgi:hypothetical protein
MLMKTELHIIVIVCNRVQPIWLYRYRYRYGDTDIQQTDTGTDTPFQNLYQTDICFEIHIKPIPIPIPIIGINLY